MTGLPCASGKPKVVVLGSINMDLVCTMPRMPSAGETIMAGDFHSTPGGKGANQAVAAARCGVVVDVGFSFAHCTPVFDGRVVRGAVRRVNLGGKALTNYLKELVSYRQWNMMDEYFLVDDVKEKVRVVFCVTM